jgi:hypothetical protein
MHALSFLCLMYVCFDHNELDLEKVVENVRSNEKLYDDIEFDQEFILESKEGDDAVPQLMRHQLDRIHYIKQGSMIYLQSRTEGSTIGGERIEWKDFLGYDGTTRRAIQNDKIANIDEGPFECVQSPHNLYLKRVGHSFPLSDYLRNNGVKINPGFRETDSRARYLGEEIVDGFACSKIGVELWIPNISKPSEGDYEITWLAHDRNYIPIRSIGYAFRYSKTLPIEEFRVVEFKEIEQDVWFPIEVEYRIYDEMKLREGVQRLSSVEKYKTNVISLNPKHPVELFRDVPFAPGALVYIMKNGQILKSYKEPSDRLANPTSKKPFVLARKSFLLGLVSTILILCVFIAVIYHRRATIRGRSSS